MNCIWHKFQLRLGLRRPNLCAWRAPIALILFIISFAPFAVSSAGIPEGLTWEQQVKEINFRVQGLASSERRALDRAKKLSQILMRMWKHRKIGLDLRDTLFLGQVPVESGLALSESELKELLRSAENHQPLKVALFAHLNERQELQSILVESLLAWSSESGAVSPLRPNETLLQRLSTLEILHAIDVVTKLRDDIEYLQGVTSPKSSLHLSKKSTEVEKKLELYLQVVQNYVHSQSRSLMQSSIGQIGQHVHVAMNTLDQGGNPEVHLTSANLLVAESLTILRNEEEIRRSLRNLYREFNKALDPASSCRARLKY